MTSNNTTQALCASKDSLSENLSTTTTSDVAGNQSGFTPYVALQITQKHKIRKSFISKEGIRVYICYLDSCARHFNHLSSLIKHERIHRNERPYVCGTCGKSFIQSSNLKRHEQSHLGKRPYKCKVCPKQFSTSYKLRKHCDIHKDGAAELNYSCTTCGKVYIYISSLNKHQKQCTGKVNTQASVQSESQDEKFEVKFEEEQPRKIVKIDETPCDLKPQCKVEAPETLEEVVSNDSSQKSPLQHTQTFPEVTKMPSNPFSSFQNQFFPPNRLQLFPSSYLPNYASSISLSQSLYNVGPSTCRFGLNFNDPALLLALQSMNAANRTMFNSSFSSESFLKGVIERQISKENMEMQRYIHQRLLQNKQF